MLTRTTWRTVCPDTIGPARSAGAAQVVTQPVSTVLETARSGQKNAINHTSAGTNMQHCRLASY